jgi:hypothetical protein
MNKTMCNGGRFKLSVKGRPSRDCMVVGFTTTCAISVHGEVYSIQHYVITFVSDLMQVSGFLRVLRFPPPIKLTDTIYN